MNGRSGARWEFRCWPPADRATEVAAHLDATTDWRRLPDERRTDTYLLPPDRPDLLPKLRGGERFEVKRRLEVRDGFELWELTVSEDWPLNASSSERAAAALAPTTFPPSLAAARARGWPVLPVTKSRCRWRRINTTIEVTRLGRDEVTVAWESPRPRHPGPIAAAPLATLPNLNYGQWVRERCARADGLPASA